jgi:hypothetical protein
MVGWRGYFGFCETPKVLIALTRWIRPRRGASGKSHSAAVAPAIRLIHLRAQHP